MASRGVDLLIAYRVIKLLVTPFNRSPAFKQGIIDKDGKVLRPYRTLKATADKQAYTMLHRFVFNLKRILAKVGIRGALGSFAVATALLLRENKHLDKTLIESTVIQWLKETNQYDDFLAEHREIPDINDTPLMTCFGVDVYERNGKLISEFEYAETL
tara:strand:- start:647 stop:1120 length:474 start_codon:yes stop_codon:yes gene_type:complete